MKEKIIFSKKEAILLVGCNVACCIGGMCSFIYRRALKKRYFDLGDDYNKLIDKYNELAIKYNDLLTRKKKFNEDVIDCLSDDLERSIKFCDLTDALLNKIENGEPIDATVRINLREDVKKLRLQSYQRLRSYADIPLQKDFEFVDKKEK